MKLHDLLYESFRVCKEIHLIISVDKKSFAGFYHKLTFADTAVLNLFDIESPK